MFVVDCGRCGKRRLLSMQRVRALRNLGGGVIAVQLACYCGQPAIAFTGRAVPRSGVVSAPDARPSEASP